MNKLVELLRDLLLVLIGEGVKDLEKFDILMAGLFLSFFLLESFLFLSISNQ